MSRVVAALVVAVIVGWPSQADASWPIVRRYLQPDVTVVSESDDRIVLRSPRLPRDVVVSRKQGATVDFVSMVERRRKSNPHRVWYATPRLLDDERLPPRTWGAIFQTPFLRIIRRAGRT